MIDHTQNLAHVVGRVAASKLAGASPRALAASSVSEVVEAYHVTPRAAEKLLAALALGLAASEERMERGAPFRGSVEVFRHFHSRLRDLGLEQLHAVLLDGKHRMMGDVLVSQGTLTSSPVHPREVFTQAIRRRAAAIILVHNHPSGDPSPSADDLEITRRLVQVGDLVGIHVLDHVIIGDGAFVSLADRGLLSA